MGADQLGFRQGSIVSVRNARLTRGRRAVRGGQYRKSLRPGVAAFQCELWHLRKEEGPPARRDAWNLLTAGAGHPLEALLWNRGRPLADRVPKSRVGTTPTTARMNREALHGTGTGWGNGRVGSGFAGPGDDSPAVN